MFDFLTIVSDLIVLLFDLLLYIKLTTPKKNTPLMHGVMYGSCFVILAVYILAAYVWELPVALSSFLFMSLPSLVIFWTLSKYKDARFFVTFCFIDTISLIIAFYARLLGMAFDIVGAAVGCVLMIAVFTLIYIKGRPYFSKYRALFERVKDGWGPTMISVIVAYAALIFVPSYPVPLRDRPEYTLVYAVLSLLILSFYVVFISSLFQKKHRFDLIDQLTKEKKWHKIAYNDALTGLGNRMAYMEHISTLSREATAEDRLLTVMLDIDGFKNINDQLGHHEGDIMLTHAAEVLKTVFSAEGYRVFRIGGDEFAVIAVNVPREELVERLHTVNTADPTLTCRFSYGVADVDYNENNGIENAFIRADAAMYTHKNSKK